MKESIRKTGQRPVCLDPREHQKVVQDWGREGQGQIPQGLVGQSKGVGKIERVFNRLVNSHLLSGKITLAAVWGTDWKGQWLQRSREMVMWLDVGC